MVDKSAPAGLAKEFEEDASAGGVGFERATRIRGVLEGGGTMRERGTKGGGVGGGGGLAGEGVVVGAACAARAARERSKSGLDGAGAELGEI